METKTKIETEDIDKVPLKERFRILRAISGASDTHIYVAHDKQEQKDVLLKLKRWENEHQLESEFAASQAIHQTNQAPHIIEAYALYEGKEAAKVLSDCSNEQYRTLTKTYCTEKVLVSEMYTPFLGLKPAHSSLRQLYRLLHIEKWKTPHGEELRKQPQVVQIFERIGRELVACLQELDDSKQVHAGLYDNQILLQMTPESLLEGTKYHDTKMMLKAIELGHLSSPKSPIPVVRGDVIHQSPERLQAQLNEPGILSHPKDDVFAVGVLLFQLLTGSAPHEPPNELSWLERVRWLYQRWEEQETAPLVKMEYIQDDITSMIQKMCAPSRDARPTPLEISECFAKAWSVTNRACIAQMASSFPPSADAMVLYISQVAKSSKKLFSQQMLPIPLYAKHLPIWLEKLAERLQEQQEEFAQSTFRTASQKTQQTQTIEMLQKEQEAQKRNLEEIETEQKKQLETLQEQHEQALLKAGQDAFEKAFEDAYKQAQEESLQRADDLLPIEAQPAAHPMQTQNIQPMHGNPNQVIQLEEQLIQLKQEYQYLRSEFRIEKEQFTLTIENILLQLDQKDSQERAQLYSAQQHMNNRMMMLNQQLQALQAEQEIIQTSINIVQNRLHTRNQIKSPQNLAPPLINQEKQSSQPNHRIPPHLGSISSQSKPTHIKGVPSQNNSLRLEEVPSQNKHSRPQDSPSHKSLPHLENFSSHKDLPYLESVSSHKDLPHLENFSSHRDLPHLESSSSHKNLPHLESSSNQEKRPSQSNLPHQEPLLLESSLEGPIEFQGDYGLFEDDFDPIPAMDGTFQSTDKLVALPLQPDSSYSLPASSLGNAVPILLENPLSSAMQTMEADLLKDDGDPQIIVGTPAMASFEELTAVPVPPPYTPIPTSQSPIVKKLSAEPSVQQLSPVVQSDVWAFFNQLEHIDWFQSDGNISSIHDLIQKHIQRLEPFTFLTGQSLPQLRAIFRAGIHQMHEYMAVPELLGTHVKQVSEDSLEKHPDDWSMAGRAAWHSLGSFLPSGTTSLFAHQSWLVPWDAAYDAILETPWFATHDVAWSTIRSLPRFAASDAAADAANHTGRGQARSVIWNMTWEYTRFAATGAIWSASNSAASDVANDVAWRLVQDQMSKQKLLNPFSPLLQIWGRGWWPILLSSGDYVVWAPLEDPNQVEILWEQEPGVNQT